MALEVTGHSVRFLAGVSLYRVARASAWAFGCIYQSENRHKPGRCENDQSSPPTRDH
jgi:hypothetical protein